MQGGQSATQPGAWAVKPAHPALLTITVACLLSDPHCSVCGGREARGAGGGNDRREGTYQRKEKRRRIIQEGGSGPAVAKVIKGHRRAAFLGLILPFSLFEGGG